MGRPKKNPPPRTTHPIIAQLHYTRVIRHISQRQLSDLAGYSHSAICYMERGQRSISFDLVVSLATALGYELRLCESSIPTKSQT